MIVSFWDNENGAGGLASWPGTLEPATAPRLHHSSSSWESRELTPMLNNEIKVNLG